MKPDKITIKHFTSASDPTFTAYSTVFFADEIPIDSDANVGELILKAFKDKPDFIGQIDADTQQKMTFQEMRERSVKCALWLKKNGISAKSVVAICAQKQMDVYVPFLACLYINAITYIWNNVSFQDEKPLAILSRTNPDVIFIQDCYIPQLTRAIDMLPTYIEKLYFEDKIVIFGEDDYFLSLENILHNTVCAEDIDKFSCTECDLQDTAMIMYTTSALGYLEEIRFPYVSFISPSNQYPPEMSFGDVGLWCEPFWWTYSPLLTVRAILSKVTTIKTLTDMNNLEVIFQLIQKYKITWIFLKYNILFEIEKIQHIVQKYDISSLRQFVYDCPDVQCFSIKCKHTKYLPKDVSCIRVYGTAETGVILTDINQGGMQMSPEISFSFINKNVKVILVNFNTKGPLSPGVLGEIWCKTPCTVSTSARHTALITDSTSGQAITFQKGWFCTGDFGFVNMDGVIFNMGKISHSVHFAPPYGQIYYFSINTFQKLLLKKYQNKLSHVEVLSLPNSLCNQIPELFVWTRPREKVTEEELRETLRQIHPEIAERALIRIALDDLPLYPNGEINRRKISSLEYKREAQTRIETCDLCNLVTYARKFCII